MFLISYSSNCTPYPTFQSINESQHSHLHKHQSDPTRGTFTPIQQTINILILLFAIIGFCTNTLTIFVFTQTSRLQRTLSNSRVRIGRQPHTTAFVHAITEATLNVVIAADMVSQMADLRDDKYISAMLFSTLTFWFINSLLCSRNWMVSLITLARLEAIFRPLHVRHNSFFSPIKSKTYAFSVILISFSLSLVRVFYKRAEVCENLSVIRFVSVWQNNKIYHYFEIFAFFIYQSLIPVSIVTLSTLVMIRFLIRKSPVNSTNTIVKKNDVKVRLTSQHHATITITVLASVFMITEMPIFFTTILHYFQPSLLVGKLQMLFQISKMLVVIDSCSNFLIYFSTSDQYRSNLKRIITKCSLHSNNNNNGNGNGNNIEFENSTCSQTNYRMNKLNNFK